MLLCVSDNDNDIDIYNYLKHWKNVFLKKDLCNKNPAWGLYHYIYSLPWIGGKEMYIKGVDSSSELVQPHASPQLLWPFTAFLLLVFLPLVKKIWTTISNPPNTTRPLLTVCHTFVSLICPLMTLRISCLCYGDDCNNYSMIGTFWLCGTLNAARVHQSNLQALLLPLLKSAFISTDFCISTSLFMQHIYNVVPI